MRRDWQTDGREGNNRRFPRECATRLKTEVFTTSRCLKETLSYRLQLNLQDEVVIALYSETVVKFT
jgi:hypothetical protein